MKSLVKDNRTLSTKYISARAKRRMIFRRWLKLNKVPRPLFKKISEKMLFKRLNFMTFLEDIRAANVKKEGT